MVGSLAGLMIGYQALREEEASQDKPEGRGLFGTPLGILHEIIPHVSFNVVGYRVFAAQAVAAILFMFMLGTALLLFSPAWFNWREGKKADKMGAAAPALQAVPSLASPIHVRRRAWLTATQTVWVPHHNCFLEAAALVFKMLKLSLRNLMGTAGYQTLTGLTPEREAADVKAWGIALDAQLTGGDDEINKARLLLSYLASCTLPDTPLRLMQKAVHTRVLFWELRTWPFRLGILNPFAMDKARRTWHEARLHYRTMHQLGRNAADMEVDEELPEHLSALLEQDCDEVLSDSVIQRAYNLAWSLPPNQNAVGSCDGMDAVVEDSAVRSPLDAISAWFSTVTLTKALVHSLDVEFCYGKRVDLVDSTMDLAIKTAPVGSMAQARALVARAVCLDDRRGARIAMALKAVGSLDPSRAAKLLNLPLIETPPSAVSTPDSLMALRCAMTLAHLGRHKENHESFDIIKTIMPGDAMTLLGWVAAFKAMKALYAHPSACQKYADKLEQLAVSLRLWIGGPGGDACNIEARIRRKSEEMCLAVAKNMVGVEGDTAYGSLSD